MNTNQFEKEIETLGEKLQDCYIHLLTTKDYPSAQRRRLQNALTQIQGKQIQMAAIIKVAQSERSKSKK